MKLSLCVPHYNEETSVVKDFLNSVRLQQNVDFNEVEVVIVNDGGDFNQLSAIKPKAFPFTLKIIQAEHGGVSATRNRAFDESTGEYVMFCDVDDTFYTLSGLFGIFSAIERTHFNALISTFMEEHRRPDGNADYVSRYSDVFVHGKVYKRQYLLDKHLRFDPNLTIHEDFYFNYLAIHLCDDPKTCIKLDTPMYLWRWRAGSVCRNDRDYIYKTYPNMLDSCTGVVNELLKRLKIGLASVMANRVVYDCYFTMNKKEWLDQKNQEYRAIAEKRFKKFYEDFVDVCKVLNEPEKNKLILGIKTRLYNEGMFLEQVTFEDWINKIKQL